MNLMEESFENQEKEKKKSKVAQIILISIILVVIIIIALFSYLMYIQSTKVTLTLDGQVNKEIQELLYEENGKIYVPIKRIAQYFNYESYNGEYTEKSENMSKCYIQGENEVVNFELNSKEIYKLDLTSTDKKENYEIVEIDEPVKYKNNELCISIDGLQKAFNVSFQQDEKGNTKIYTLPYLAQGYETMVLNYGYTEISPEFVNQRAILEQEVLIVKNEKDQYAVIGLEGDIILEPKYDKITYIPSIEDFLVESNEKLGIMSKNKKTKIAINYDSIELINKEKELYVVKKDDKYGVVDTRGNTIINIQNDEIGIDINQFKENNIKNSYVLIDSLIPVKKDKYWALYNLSGKQVVDYKYDSFGYIAASNKDVLNLLEIPDYNVLVACKDKKYTLLNSSGVELIRSDVAEGIYMKIGEDEKKNYFILANNSEINAVDYLKSLDVKVNNENNSENSNNMNNTNNTNNNDTNNNSSETEQNNQNNENEENNQNEETEENNQENQE